MDHVRPQDKDMNAPPVEDTLVLTEDVGSIKILIEFLGCMNEVTPTINPETLRNAADEYENLLRCRERLAFMFGPKAERRGLRISKCDIGADDYRYRVYEGLIPVLVGNGPTPLSAIDNAIKKEAKT